jgi:3-hydroxyisobutyrate dehydrogenase-like beta-hydroxyacid dehydrogenase
MTTPQVLLLGFGEVGQTLGAEFIARGLSRLAAWDQLFPWPESPPSLALMDAPFANHIAPGHNLAGALNAAGVMSHDGEQNPSNVLIISAVTAEQCLPAAEETARLLTKLGASAWYLDLNSASPATKQSASTVINAAGGRYVEAAVMSPIHPQRLAAPVLLGGSWAAAFLPVAEALGFTGMQVFADVIGRASAAKMCRSIMVKGMEALLTESLLTARHHGVEDTVLASLQDLFPLGDWEKLAHYMVSRSVQHGRRRAEEMRQVAATVREAGLEPWMSSGCAERQAWAAPHRTALTNKNLKNLLDAVLASVPAPQA